MFGKVDGHEKTDLLEQVKAQREGRALERQKEKSALQIQVLTFIMIYFC